MPRKAPAPKVENPPTPSTSKAKPKKQPKKQHKASSVQKTQPYVSVEKPPKISQKKKALPKTTRKKAPEKTVTLRAPKQPSKTARLTSLIHEQVKESANTTAPEPTQPGPEGALICNEDPARL